MHPYLIKTQLILVILLGFFLPISTAAVNILMPLMIITLAFEKEYRKKWQILKTHPIAMSSLLFFSFILLAMSYTSASLSQSLYIVDKYKELLYISFFILLFQNKQLQKAALYSFLTSITVMLLLSYFVVLFEINIAKATVAHPYLFKNYITQSILTTIAAYFLTILSIEYKKYRIWLLLIVLLAVFNLIFMSHGRIGYVLFAVLSLLLFFQFYRLKGMLIGGVIISVLITMAYLTSDVLQQRINKVFLDLEAYQQGEMETSIGLRTEYYRHSFALFMQHPFIGTGTGSFEPRYAGLAVKEKTPVTTNPHNEYLMAAVQWGSVGLFLLLWLFFQLWRTSFYLSQQYVWMAQGLVVAIAVGCLFNSLLLDSTEGHLFALFVGIYYANLKQRIE